MRNTQHAPIQRQSIGCVALRGACECPVCVYAQKHVSHTPQTITSDFLNECKNDTAKTCNMQLPLPLRIHTHTHTHTVFFHEHQSLIHLTAFDLFNKN